VIPTPRFFLPLAALFLVACDGPAEQSVQITASRQASRAAKKARTLTTAQRFGGSPLGKAAPPQAVPPAKGLSLVWTVPAGWKEIAPTSMRLANLQVPPDGQCYVTALPGRAGGIQDNLNRWRKQMGLGPTTREELAKLPRRQILGVQGTEVSLDGAFSGMGGSPQSGFRMRGVIATFQGHTVFVKFVGPQATVAGASDGFEAFCESLRPKGQRGTSPPPPMPTSPFARLTWSEPKGWLKAASPSRMRLVTFNVPDLAGSECYLTVLSGKAGGEAANLERWQKQLGLPPLGEAGLGKLERAKVLGQDVALYEGTGTFDAGQGPKANTYLAGCLVTVGDQTLFVKFVVPGGGPGAGRAGFLAFLQSLKVNK
jgi:hypothetical protein